MHKSKGRDIVNVVVDDHPQALGTVVLGHFLEAEGFGHPRTSPFSHGKLGLPHCGGSQINLEPWKSCAFHVQIQSVMLFQDFRKWTSTTTANETTITTSTTRIHKSDMAAIHFGLRAGESQGFLEAALQVWDETDGENYHVEDSEPQCCHANVGQDMQIRANAREKTHSIHWFQGNSRGNMRKPWFLPPNMWIFCRFSWEAPDQSLKNMKTRHMRVVSCCSPSPHLPKHRVMLWNQDSVSCWLWVYWIQATGGPQRPYGIMGIPSLQNEIPQLGDPKWIGSCTTPGGSRHV